MCARPTSLSTDSDTQTNTTTTTKLIKKDLSGRNTFWNLRAGSGRIVLPPYTWGPLVNWVDAQGASAVRD